jgi:OOP family OmpA-OmpF porin
MRKYVAPVLCTVLMVGALGAMTGCTASAGIQAGGGETKPPPPPPPTTPPPADVKPPEPKPEVKMDGNKILLPGAIVFKTGSAEIDLTVSEPILLMVKDYLDSKPKVTLLRVEGHTDSDGDDKANLELSAKRSQSVAKYLVGKGVDCKRLIPVGFGETKPVADNKTPEGKAQNRRTDFINAAISGKPIMGMPVDAGAPKVMDACAP